MRFFTVFRAAALSTIMLMTAVPPLFAAFGDCPSGYVFRPQSGVGCMQENCGEIQSAHYSYEGYCVCGSSGSIAENPEDPNKECSYGSDNASCPGCVYACVNLDEECPGATPASPAQGEGEAVPGDAGVVPGDAGPTPVSEDLQPPEEAPPEEAPSEEPPAGLQDPFSVTAPLTTAGFQMPEITQETQEQGPTQETEESAGTQQSSEAPPETQQSATAPLTSLLTAPDQTATTRTCEQECRKLRRGGQYDEVMEVSGTPPNCKCTVDNKDKDNRLTQTVQMDGDIRTTFTFDPATGELIKKDTISMSAERERIRQQLGYKYDEEQIDRMLGDENINKWFTDKMSDIETNASYFSLSFWWQHVVALLDHGYENSADFVDTYKYGRCGDSMQWLEREITNSLGLNGKMDNKSEAVLSLTGESYDNILNHTSLIVRPAGYSNIEWADLVSELTATTKAGGLTEADIKGLDPRLLDAKVLDPYYRKQTTVREFIKGWSVLKIS